MACRKTFAKLPGESNRQGFTLIEVLIAMAIFSIGILAAGAMQLSSTNSNTGARIQTEAYTWVVDQIERLAALDYDDTDLEAGPHSITRELYTVSWRVWDDTPVAGAKHIEVTADDSHGRARPLSIEFIKAR